MQNINIKSHIQGISISNGQISSCCLLLIIYHFQQNLFYAKIFISSQLLYLMNYRPNPLSGPGYQPTRLGGSYISQHYSPQPRNGAFHDEHDFGDIEYMLNNERKKFKQAKQKFQYDLDNERKLRIEFENKLIKLKDEFSQKEVAFSEIQFKVNNLLHQNQDIILQNERLRNQLGRLEDLYGAKIHQLETQLSLEIRNYEEMTNQYNSQFEKFKKQGQDYVEQITFDFEKRIKNLEEKLKIAENSRRDLGAQNKKLNDILISNKLAFEEEIRDLKNKARQEEMKKVQLITKSYDQKLKVIEDSKQGIIRKNNQIIRLLQDKDRQLQSIEAEKEDEINRLRQDNTELNQQHNHLNYLISKLKGQIADKQSMLGRNYNDNDHQLQALKQQVELKKQEATQLSSTIRDLRIALKDAQGQSERRRRDLQERCNFFESEARKYKQQYQRICQMLKSRINQTINNTVTYKK